MAVKVAIIGCGASGLSSIKACLDAGLQPTCFEQQSSFGGLWNYREEPRASQYYDIASVHNCTVTNTCKLTTCFSDFPFPIDFPNFMPHRYVQEYLEMYAKHFDLVKYVRFNSVVVSLTKSIDHEQTGRWVVTYSKLDESQDQDGESTNRTQYEEICFDAVMVCNGHFWDQAKPNIPGMEGFAGIQVHSGDYRTFHPFTDKRVVVVGAAHSGADIASELSYHASQVYLSTRRGCYYFRRGGLQGLPTEFQMSRATRMLPLPLKVSQLLTSGLVNNFIDMSRFGLEPVGTLGVNQTPFVNDELDHRIITGHIIVKDDIKEIGENSVVFKDGHVVENVDALIYATGFKLSIPFVEDDIISIKENYYMRLHKHIFPPDLERNTLAVIGAISSSGPALPVVEMQARVATEVFNGQCILPRKDEMIDEIVKREERLRKNGFIRDKLMRIQFSDYLDELAAMIGAKPSFWPLFRDPKLGLKYMFGPIVPAHYRLQGPNLCKDARSIILTSNEQCLYPLRSRKCSPTKSNSKTYLLLFALVGFMFAVIVVTLGPKQ